MSAGARPAVPPVTARAFDPGFDEGDCAYNALHIGGDGYVYFAIGTHSRDRHAAIGRFDPTTSQFVPVDDIAAAVGDVEPGTPPHGKVHVPLAEVEGRIVLATMQGAARRRGERVAYPGFRILALDMRSGTLRELVRGPRGEGLVSAVMDPVRGLYSGLTYPGGFFCQYDLTTGSLRVSGRPCFDWRLTRHLRLVHPVCRSLCVDTDGAVYGSSSDGVVWRADPFRTPERLSGVNVREGVVPPWEGSARRDHAWRVMVPDPARGCVYGLHRATASLFRFEPRRRSVQPVGRLGPRATHDLGRAPHASRLAMAMGPDRVIYYISYDKPDPSGDQPPGAYLTSYELDRDRFREHGPIETDAGERVIFAESLAVDGSGALYTLGWVEANDPDRQAYYARLRKAAAPPLPPASGYRMMLLRIGADALGTPT